MLYKLRLSFFQSIEPKHMCNSSNTNVVYPEALANLF
jgi:hypothetical protein